MRSRGAGRLDGYMRQIKDSCDVSSRRQRRVCTGGLVVAWILNGGVYVWNILGLFLERLIVVGLQDFLDSPLLTPNGCQGSGITTFLDCCLYVCLDTLMTCLSTSKTSQQLIRSLPWNFSWQLHSATQSA